MVKSVLSRGEVRYNIKLIKRNLTNNKLNMGANLFEGIMAGAFAIYLYKKYLHLNGQKPIEV